MSSNSAVGKSSTQTPSRIPVTTSRTPIAIKSTASRSIVPLEANNVPSIAEVNVSSAPNAAGRTIVVMSSPGSRQSSQPSAMPVTVVPAPNMTINVNVNGSTPQSSKQTINTIGNNLDHSEKSMSKSKNAKPNSSGDSLMTNDSDSVENQVNISGPCDTPTGNLRNDSNNHSARRQLFASQPNVEQMRRSATFDKIDNLTRTIMNGNSMASPIGGIQATPKSTPRSQTFVKPKISMQNATYDIQTANESDRVPCHLQYNGIDTREYLSLNRTDDNQEMQADLPSEARLDSIDHITDDGNNGLNQVKEHFANGSSDRSSNSSAISIHSDKTNDKQVQNIPYINQAIKRYNLSSSNFNPVVSLNRIDTRLSEIGVLSPPSMFQNTRNSRFNDYIDDKSPETSLRNINKVSHSFHNFIPFIEYALINEALIFNSYYRLLFESPRLRIQNNQQRNLSVEKDRQKRKKVKT